MVCKQCVERFQSTMLKLIALTPHLDDALGQHYDFSKRDRITGTKDVGIVLNEQAFETKTKIRDWANWVEGVIITEGGATGFPNEFETIQILKFIIRHHEWLMNHQLAGDLVTDASGLLNQVASTTNPIRRARMTVPGEKCKQELEGETCNGELVATLRDDNGKTALYLYCTKDAAHTLKPDQFIPVSRKVRNLHISAEEAAMVLNVVAVHIHVLAKRKGWRSFKANKKRFFQWADIEKHLNERNAA
jgi:hypothetical protein